MKERTIFVYADWTTNGPQLIGRLYAGENRGKLRDFPQRNF